MKLLARFRSSSKGSDSSGKGWDSSGDYLNYEESSQSSFNSTDIQGHPEEVICVNSRYNQVGKVLKHLPKSAASVRSTMRRKRAASREVDGIFVDKEELCDRLVMEEVKS